jgi:hypothetical protein
LAVRRPAHAPGFYQVQAKRSDPFQESMQSRLVKFAADDRDYTSGTHAKAREGGGRGVVKLASDAYLVTIWHGVP